MSDIVPFGYITKLHAKQALSYVLHVGTQQARKFSSAASYPKEKTVDEFIVSK